MKYLLACRSDGVTLFLNERGSLTEHKEQARVLLSLSSAEFERDKWNRKRRRVMGKEAEKLYVWPLREWARPGA